MAELKKKRFPIDVLLDAIYDAHLVTDAEGNPTRNSYDNLYNFMVGEGLELSPEKDTKSIIIGEIFTQHPTLAGIDVLELIRMLERTMPVAPLEQTVSKEQEVAEYRRRNAPRNKAIKKWIAEKREQLGLPESLVIEELPHDTYPRVESEPYWKLLAEAKVGPGVVLYDGFGGIGMAFLAAETIEENLLLCLSDVHGFFDGDNRQHFIDAYVGVTTPEDGVRLDSALRKISSLTGLGIDKDVNFDVVKKCYEEELEGIVSAFEALPSNIDSNIRKAIVGLITDMNDYLKQVMKLSVQRGVE